PAAAVAVFVTAVVAESRQITGTGQAVDASWWADYAEHVSLLGVAALFASTGRPGWRILAALTGAVWSYLGLVAIFSLPDQAGSWGILGGLAGLATGLVLVGAAALGEGEQRARVVGHLRPHHA